MSAQGSGRGRNAKLDQLTSLRFVAAFMIVVHHSVDLFGIRSPGVNLDHGVSFFFVLSGFILTYVYPTLETWPEVRRFWRARVARIWPAYLTSFLLGFWLLHYPFEVKTGAAHLFLLQGWIPKSTYYFSYNAVAWSVSVECFFYLAFPILIHRWADSWRPKLALSGALLVGLMWLSDTLGLPAYGSPVVGSDGSLVTQHGLIYIGPLARIFEFIFGMSICIAWRRGVQWTPFRATIYELAAIMLCVGSMYYTSFIAAWSLSVFGASAAVWVTHSGSMFAFGALIYVMAHGLGKLSSVLAAPPLVTLGEISFSVYLIHQILLNYYRSHLPTFTRLPEALGFLVFVGVLLLASYVIWACIEMPARRVIAGQRSPQPGRGKSEPTALLSHPGRAGLAASCLVGLLVFAMGGGGSVDQADALGRESTVRDRAVDRPLAPLQGFVQRRFADLFTLRSVDIVCASDGLIVRLAWESDADQSLRFSNAIHLVSEGGEILGQADYRQSAATRSVKRGETWLDTLSIPKERVTNRVKALAIGIYDDATTLLPIPGRDTDWDGRRLVIPVHECPAGS